MPRTFSFQSLEDGPIATRTRLRLGETIKPVPPVQYPESWPLLPYAVAYSNTQSPSIISSQTDLTVTNPIRCIKPTDALLESGLKLSLRRNIDPDSVLIQPCRRRPRQKTFVGKKIQGSQVDLVVLRSRQKNDSHLIKAKKEAKESRKRRSDARKARKKLGQRRTRSKKRRVRSVKKRQNGRKSKRRGKNRKASRSVRRKKKVRQRRKKRNQKLSKGRRCRRKRSSDESPERKYGIDTGPPPGHALDYMMRQKNSAPVDDAETKLDETRDDPLNITELCRALVKSLPGVPADLREDNTDDKNNRPDNERPGMANRKIDKDLERKLRHAMEKNKTLNETKHKPRRVRDSKSRRNHHKRVKSSPNANNKNQNRGHHGRQSRRHHGQNLKTKKHNVNESVSSSDDGRSVHFEGNETNSDVSIQQNQSDSRKQNESKLKNKQTSRICKNPIQTNQYKKQCKESNDSQIINNDRTFQTKKDDTGRPTPKSHATKSVHQGPPSKPPPKRIRDKKNPIVIPFHGKPPPRNRRRDEIDIIRNQKDIKKFVKRSAKTSSQEKDKKTGVSKTSSPAKDQKTDGSKRHRVPDHKHRQQTSLSRKRHKKRSTRSINRSSRRSKGHCRDRKSLKRHQQRLEASSSLQSPSSTSTLNKKSNDGDCDDNGNNNVNNNEMDPGSWGRVSGRLLRIGRYLFRRFSMFWF